MRLLLVPVVYRGVTYYAAAEPPVYSLAELRTAALAQLRAARLRDRDAATVRVEVEPPVSDGPVDGHIAALRRRG